MEIIMREFRDRDEHYFFQLVFLCSPKKFRLNFVSTVDDCIKQPQRAIFTQYLDTYKNFFLLFFAKYFLVHTRYGEEVIFITQRQKLWLINEVTMDKASSSNTRTMNVFMAETSVFRVLCSFALISLCRTTEQYALTMNTYERFRRVYAIRFGYVIGCTAVWVQENNKCTHTQRL